MNTTIHLNDMALEVEEVLTAGLEGRAYVMGALDPTYAHPDVRDAMALSLVRPGRVWTHAQAARISAAFLAGWVTHRTYDAPDCPCRTPESTWLSAASCGYGSGYEPGSQFDWDPACPWHMDLTYRTRAAQDAHDQAEAAWVDSLDDLDGFLRTLGVDR